MALKVTTTIRNMREADKSDFGCDRDYHLLTMCDATGAEVTVASEVADGYYDVTLPNGHTAAAVSWYHLDGFTADGINL